jgi:hypothetical protein
MIPLKEQKLLIHAMHQQTMREKNAMCTLHPGITDDLLEIPTLTIPSSASTAPISSHLPLPFHPIRAFFKSSGKQHRRHKHQRFGTPC